MAGMRVYVLGNASAPESLKRQGSRAGQVDARTDLR